MCSISKTTGKKPIIDRLQKVPIKDVTLGEPTSFLDNVYLGCSQRECQKSTDIVDKYRNRFESKISVGAAEELPNPEKFDANICLWSFDGRPCKEMCGAMLRADEQNNPATAQSYNSILFVHKLF